MGSQKTGFDGTTRLSGYLPLADGTRLAYDLILPTIDCRPSQRPLPTLLKYTPYLRAYTLRGEQQKSRVAELYRMPPAERAALQDLDLLDPRHLTGWLAALVRQGYAAIVIERPGTGASFGKADTTFPGAAREADQVLGWIAAQAWCNGRIGMWGHSWEGQTQLAAASTGNPHLKAIMPAATYMDAYGAFYRGGIYNRAFGRIFMWSNTILDSIVTPVDSDAGGSTLAQARAERGGAAVGQTMTDARLRAFPFRDSELAHGLRLWESPSPYPLLERINAAGVAVYLVAGWYDIFARDTLLLYRNLTVPKRLLVRPLDHSRIDAIAPDLDYGAEVQRWFDHWLKGVDTGIMDEPAVRYYLLGDARGNRWHGGQQWPPGQPQRHLTLLPGRRRLLMSSPAATAGGDAYTIDYGTTTGEDTRWTAVNWEHVYGDLAANDARAISYTSVPLQESLRAVGHPVAHLWLRTAAPDLDIFAYLEQVDDQGRSGYVTEGALRASHRATAEPPYNNLGLPYHDHCQSHLAPIPRAEPFEVAIDLEPTGFEFPSGSRIRLTIAFRRCRQLRHPHPGTRTQGRAALRYRPPIARGNPDRRILNDLPWSVLPRPEQWLRRLSSRFEWQKKIVGPMDVSPDSRAVPGLHGVGDQDHRRRLPGPQTARGRGGMAYWDLSRPTRPASPDPRHIGRVSSRPDLMHERASAAGHAGARRSL